MTVYISTMEGTHDAVMSTTNHGGAAFTAVVGSPKFTNVDKAHGNTSVTVGTSNSSCYWSYDAGTKISKKRVYIKLDAAIGSADGEQIILNNYFSGSLNAARVIINTANKLRIHTFDAAGAKNADRWTGGTQGTGQTSSTNTVPVGVWVRIELYVNVTTGEVWAAMYLGDSTTPIETSGDITGLDLAGTIDELTIGRLSWTTKYDVDDFAAATGADANKNPWPVGNTAPSVTAPEFVAVAGGSTAEVTAVGSDVDGNPVTYAWSVVSSTGATPTFSSTTSPTTVVSALPAGNVAIVRCTVSDGTATAFDDVEIRYLVPAGTSFRPLNRNAEITVGTGWTRVGGTTEGGVLADDSPTTYIESPQVSGSAVSKRIRMAPTYPRGLDHGFSVQHATDTGTLSLTIRVYSPVGGLLHTFAPVTSTTTAAFTNFELPDAVINAMSAAQWQTYYVEGEFAQ